MDYLKSSKTLTVLIGTRNRLPLLKCCLASIVGKVDVACRVIVIDAGSTDGTIEFLENFENIDFIQDGRPLGQAQSFNRVLKKLHSRYVCWLSDDNELVLGALDCAVNALESDSNIGMVALKVRDVSGGREDKAYIGGLRESGIITCNQGVLRTKLMQDVGGFDESFRDYGIDVDLTAKVLLNGKKIVLTKNVSVLHHRDHHGMPGAIGNQRNARVKRSYSLFTEKYPFLEEYSLLAKIRRVWWRLIWKSLSFFALGFHNNESFKNNETLLNYYNVLNGRYVSKLDFWKARHKDFYIIQSMPKKLQAWGKRTCV